VKKGVLRGSNIIGKYEPFFGGENIIAIKTKKRRSLTIQRGAREKRK